MVVAEGGWAAALDVPFDRNFLIIGGVEDVDLSSYNLPDGWHMELKYFTDCLRDGVNPYKYQTLDSIGDTYKILTAEKSAILQGKTIVIKK